MNKCGIIYQIAINIYIAQSYGHSSTFLATVAQQTLLLALRILLPLPFEKMKAQIVKQTNCHLNQQPEKIEAHHLWHTENMCTNNSINGTTANSGKTKNHIKPDILFNLLLIWKFKCKYVKYVWCVRCKFPCRSSHSCAVEWSECVCERKAERW